MRLILASAASLWIGLVLLLSTNRWFARRPLTERLRPYSPGGMSPSYRPGLLSVGSFREVVGPVSQAVGAQIGRVFGVSEDLGRRLERVHSTLDVTEFRTRQLGWAVAAMGAAVAVVATLGPPPAMGALILLGGPLLTFLVLEQSVSRASDRWRRRLFLELPVVSEQLGMLLSAGYSLSGALNRVAARSQGVCGKDLARAVSRTRQGLTEAEALDEWADLAGVEAVHRLVRVLSLNREAGDLGRLIAEEARSIRRDVQREMVARIERREQQVWIPVTVATLLPGVIFMAVPFLDAMRLFTGP